MSPLWDCCLISRWCGGGLWSVKRSWIFWRKPHGHRWIIWLSIYRQALGMRNWPWRNSVRLVQLWWWPRRMPCPCWTRWKTLWCLKKLGSQCWALWAIWGRRLARHVAHRRRGWGVAHLSEVCDQPILAQWPSDAAWQSCRCKALFPRCLEALAWSVLKQVMSLPIDYQGRLGRLKWRNDMSIKSDQWIETMAREHEMIQPFHAEQVKCNAQGSDSFLMGHPVMVKRSLCGWVYDFYQRRLVDPKAFSEDSFVSLTSDVCIIPPNSFVLARTVERFKILAMF